MAKRLEKDIATVDGGFDQPNYADQYMAGGFVIASKLNKKGDGVDLTYTPGPIHNTVIGSTGSGKSVNLISPSIVSIANTRCSMIISDPKGEMYKQFAPYLKDKGYKVHLLDYFDVSSGIRFNQMQLINDAYREGLPHFYAGKAIDAIIKLINNIMDGKEVDFEYALKTPAYTASASDFTIPIYTVKNFSELKDENEKPLSFIDSAPVIDFNDKDNAALYISLIQQFLTDAEAFVEDCANGKAENGTTPVFATNTGKSTMSSRNSKPVCPDIKNRNNYYINRERETINQAVKILNEVNNDVIRAFFEQQEHYYKQLLDEIPDENLQKPQFASTHQKYVDILDGIDKSIAEHDAGFIDMHYFLEYLQERSKFEKASFKSVEERAVKNANTIAEIIVTASNEGGKKGEKIWEETPKAMISSLVIMTARDGFIEAQKHLGSVYLQLANLTEDIPGGKPGQSMNTIDRIFQHYTATDFAKLSMAAVKAAGDRTKSSIVVSSIPPMKVWSEPSVVSQSCATDLELESIVDQPTCIFLNFGGADSSQTYTFLVTLFIEQMYTVLNDICARTEKLTLPRPVYYLLDEFCNLPAVPNMGAKISLARSKGIRFNIVTQSISQLDKVYSKEERSLILENSNLVYLLTNMTETAEFISKRLGKYTIQVENKSEGTSSSKGQNGSSSTSSNTSTQKLGRELMTPEELMNLKENTGLYIAPRVHPFKVSYLPSYKWPLFTKDIFPHALREIHQKRPHYDPEYFLPADYEKFIYAYMLINNDCIFDELFNTWWTQKLKQLAMPPVQTGVGGASSGRDHSIQPEDEAMAEELAAEIDMDLPEY